MPAHVDPFVCDTSRLPYPVAITAQRFIDARDVHWKVSYLKDCFEATVKFCAAILLAEYFKSSAANRDQNKLLLKSLNKTSLGDWLQVVEDLSRLLIEAAPKETLGHEVASWFVWLPLQKGSKPKLTKLLSNCKKFVPYRNESVYGHGRTSSPAGFENQQGEWSPILIELLIQVTKLSGWQLCLVTSANTCSVWMGTAHGTTTQPGQFSKDVCGHFVLYQTTKIEAGVANERITDLFPFFCDLPDREHAWDRLHSYDSIHRYDERRKEAKVLGYHGDDPRPVSDIPIAGLERLFTSELMAESFIAHQGRMEIIEGRVAGFVELIAEHADIVGRKFVISEVKSFIDDNDRGLLVIEGEPGKGKTALMCHLIANEFRNRVPQPIRFFYRRTAGITDPDVCVRTIYDELLKTHDLSESDDTKMKTSPEEMMKKLTELLSGTIAPMLSPSRPQLILIDALDEAEKTSSGKDAFQRIPESLPKGVYVIVTTRKLPDLAQLSRRSHVHPCNLDRPDLLLDNLSDGTTFVQRELKDCSVPNETMKEIARIGAGNFLVLTHLVNRFRESSDTSRADELLRRIATEPASGRLSSIYEEFWKRLTGQLKRVEIQILCNVAGLLVSARCPLSAEMICDCLQLPFADWDFASDHLGEYLTQIEPTEEGESEKYYRIYHESFADFLRAKIAPDLRQLENRLADYCRHWSKHARGRGRLYALRFGPEHLMRAAKHDPRRWNEVEELLTDIFFLEAKSQAGFVSELATDFSTAWQAMPSDLAARPILLLLGEAIRRGAHLIAEHSVDYPQGLFQCVWNLAWWYGNPETEQYYQQEDQTGSRKKKGENVESPVRSGQREVGVAMVQLLERWRTAKESVDPGFHWLRSRRPPVAPLGGSQLAIIPASRGGGEWVGCTADGKLLAGGDGTSLRIWNANTLVEIDRMPEWKGQQFPLQAAAISPDGNLLIAACGRSSFTVGKATNRESRPLLAAWGTASGNLKTFSHRHKHEINDIAFSPDGSRFATASSDRTIRVWDAKTFKEIGVLRGSESRVASLYWSPDGRQIVAGADAIRIWDVSSNHQIRVIQFDWANDFGIGFQVCYSPDGTRIAASLDRLTVFILDAETGEILARTAQPVDVVDCICFSPDGERVVYAEEGGPIVVSDARTGATFCQLLGHEIEFHTTTVCYFPDGKRIASGSSDGTIRIWAVDSEAPAANLAGVVAEETEQIAFIDAGKRILSVSTEGLCIWDGQSGIRLKEFESAGARSPYPKYARSCAQFWPSSNEHPASLKVWEPWTCKVVWNRQWEARLSCSFDLSPDAKRIAFTEMIRGTKYVVRLFDVSHSKELIRLKGHDDEINDVRFSTNGVQIATASSDYTARVWDAATGESLIRIHHEAAVRKVWFSPDGTQIVTFSDEGVLRVFDADGGIEYFVLEQNVQSINDVYFSPDGARIAVAASVGIFIWDAKTGKLLEAIPGHGDIQAIAAEVEGMSFRLLDQGGETVIETPSGQIVARYPHAGWSRVASHPDGLTWAGVLGDYFALLHLEGTKNS